MNEQLLYNALKSNNMPNLLIYGVKNSGKKAKLFGILKELYKPSKSINKIINDIHYSYNDTYYEFNMNYVKNKNYTTFINIINEIIKSINHFGKLVNKLIILKNFQNIKQSIQNSLRVIIEKYRNTTVFIFITNKYNSIHSPIISRCLCIRFSSLNNKEKRNLIHSTINYKECTPEFYDFIYQINNEHEIKLLIHCKDIYHKNFSNPYDKICQKIMEIYKTQKYSPILHENLRQIAYNIERFNLNIQELYQSFLDLILKDQTIRDKVKYKIIELFSKSEYEHTKSYRSLIVLESLLFNLFEIL